MVSDRLSASILNEKDELFAKAFCLSPDCAAIVRMSDRTILMANDAMCRLWGVAQAEVLGKRAKDYTNWLTEEEGVRFVNELTAKGECLNYETMLRLNNGRRAWFNVSSRLIPWGPDQCVLSVMTDITERRRSSSLLGMQKRVFEQVASGAPLSAILEEVALSVERELPGTLCSILLLDADGVRLRLGAGRSLPPSYNSAVDGLVIGPAVGSCGTAVFRGKPVIVADTQSDPLWADFRELALKHSLRACWSTPIFSPSGRQGRILGTFALYAREVGEPDENFHQIVPHVAHLVGIAIERYRSDAALRESEARYRGTLDGMLEGCQIIGRDWRYLYMNELAAKQGRRQVGDLLGRTMMECYPGIDSTPLFAALKRCMEGRFGEQLENTFTYPDGSVASFQLGIQPVPEGLFVLSLDITERKRAEMALRQSREEFKDLFDNAPIGYHEVDAEGRLTRINRAELSMLGYSEEELLGQFVWKIAAHQEISHDAVRQKLGGNPPPAAFERMFKRKDGSVFPVLIRDRLIRRDDGTVTGISAVIQDITERKKTEHEIRQLNADLERRVAERTAQLEMANQELEAFSYSVSHDLRTPLRAVDGFSQAVMEDFGPQLPAEGRRQLQVIRDSAQRMGQLIDDLLTFSRLNRQSLRKQTVDTHGVVRATLDELKGELRERKVEIKIGDLSPCLGDPALLRQVWINLLSNALKYTRKRDQAIVEIGSVGDGSETIYFVRDNGTGFDMRYAHKLFGVFQRLHRAEDYEGTGVGLAIVQRVVSRHGGRVWAESSVDQGATFRFTLTKENKT